ncbi:PhzF family phenazine biosynthesis protein [Rossellomorea marisflavi]|uniref:PhzF family phenazine biosynthesis protein n=1 Tax=Rossellomorea marisflavi TaxID=189381 RepID=UPI00296E831B|nr:PhzF family phenazine biosynthesis protein [Rossellomorea marisflavi]MDW4525666.1 PhzF family phenazine biosynthesis protein [Rossellomorea marisflavi]
MMKFFIVDAFTDVPFGGNPAGVVLVDERDESFMQLFARELGYSETAFVERKSDFSFHVRFFTPNTEVDLCGHATIAAFTVLLDNGLVADGRSYIMKTGAGDITVHLTNGRIMMEQAPPSLGNLCEDEKELAELLGIEVSSIEGALPPRAVSTGLMDLMVPITSRLALDAITPDMKALAAYQKKHGLEGIHAFTLDTTDALACSRNFSPLYGIDEESATGTASGAMTYYLYHYGVLTEFEEEFRCLQGENLQRPSVITTVLTDPAKPRVLVGGTGIVISEGTIRI